jgi:peptide/nickel transport system permease protein
LTFGLLLVGGLTLAALIAPLLTTFDLIGSPTETAIHAKLLPPGPGHWLGTDELGRDVLSRLVHGARSSLAVALVATLVALIIGVPAGALAGLRGGFWDLTLTRLMEVTASLPSLPLILLILSLTLEREGTGGLGTLVLLAVAIGVTRWSGIARYIRGGIWKTQVEEYVMGSRALGSGRTRLLVRHLLPAAVPPALVSAAFGAGSAVLLESALSFLGLGTQPPLPSWGRMVASAAQEPGAWWLLLAPGMAIAILVMGFNLLAEGIRPEGAAPVAASGRGHP